MKSVIKILQNKIGLCSILCFVMICLTGCSGAIDTNITIDRKGNATIEEITKLDNELAALIEEMGSSLNNIVNKINRKNDPNLSAELIDDSEYSSIKIIKKIKDIQNNDITHDEFLLHDEIKNNCDNNRFVDVKKSFWTTEYNINFNVTLKKDVKILKTKISIKIPTSAKKHNATEVDKKKNIYTWKITEPSQNVSLSYTILNVLNILLCVLPVVSLLLILIILVLIKKRKQIIVNCPYCKEEIEENLKKCPICGENINLFPKLSFNILKIMFVVLGIFILIGLGFFGFVNYESNSLNKVLLAHEETDSYENTMSMKESIDIIAKQGENLSNYIKSPHLGSNKDKAFHNFISNINYYSEVFSFQNERQSYINSTYSPTCISAYNKNLKQGLRTTINDIEVTPVTGEMSPPNSNSPFSYLKITNIEVPFIKLVYYAGYCGRRTDLQDGIGYIVNCDGPNYFVAVPNYKNLKATYSPYLSNAWREYFDIKVNQQETLRNSAFENGNGGMYPAYISHEDVDNWTNSFVALLDKYPNFIMYDNITDEIIEMNYPSYKSLLKDVPQNSRLYSKLKKAQEDLDAEFSY